MNNFFFKNATISDVLFAYLNIFGVALITAFLVCLGLRLFLNNRKHLSKKRVFGLCLIIGAFLFFLRSLVLAFASS